MKKIRLYEMGLISRRLNDAYEQGGMPAVHELADRLRDEFPKQPQIRMIDAHVDYLQADLNWKLRSLGIR